VNEEEEMPSWLRGLLGLAIVAGYVYVGLRSARGYYTRENPRTREYRELVIFLAVLVSVFWPVTLAGLGFHRYVTGGVRVAAAQRERERAAANERITELEDQLLTWTRLAADADLPAAVRESAEQLHAGCQRELSQLRGSRVSR
jgi:hypothetical protein